MPSIVVEVTIDAPRHALYQLSQDFAHRLEWDTLARRVRFEQGAVTSQMGLVGALRYCNPFRLTMEHVGLLSPSLFATNMLRGPVFFSRLLGSWRFESMDEARTRVVLQCQFHSRWPWLRWLLDPVLTKVLLRDSQRALRDLKNAAENTDILRRL